jgi:predicted Zn-dependent peptidase
MWHRRFVHAGNMIVGVSGDFEQAEMVALLKQKLANPTDEPEAGDRTGDGLCADPARALLCAQKAS